jgi:hypothetical protein
LETRVLPKLYVVGSIPIARSKIATSDEKDGRFGGSVERERFEDVSTGRVLRGKYRRRGEAGGRR